MLTDETTPSDDDKPKVLKLRGFPGRSKEPTKAEKWVISIYEKLPKNPLDDRQVAMVFGEGEDQQIALFELRPSMTDSNAAYIEWFQAYPQKQGVGTKAMSRLQDLARAAGIKLILTSWKHGKVPERVLNRFYRDMGFKPGKSREGMVWDPSIDEAFRNHADDDYADPRKRRKISRTNPLKYDPVFKDVKYDPDDDGIREPSVTKYVKGLGLFIMTGHFRDRLRQRKIDPADAFGLIERVFKDKFHKVQNIPYGVEALIVDDRSTLGIIMLKEPGKPSNKYIFKTAHPKYTRYSHRYVIRESEDLNKPTPGIEELAVKYNVSVHDVLRELKKGVEVETEHTDKLHVAREIALDHLSEDLYYYVKLAKTEKTIKEKDDDDEDEPPYPEMLCNSSTMRSAQDQIESVREHGWTIRFIKNPDPALWSDLEAKSSIVKTILRLLVDEDIDDACMIFNHLRRHGCPWPELGAIERNLVKSHGWALPFIDDPSPLLWSDPEVKSSVIRSLLRSIAKESFKSKHAIEMLHYLSNHGCPWPELEVVEHSLRIDGQLKAEEK